jgi:hypothetical protein
MGNSKGYRLNARFSMQNKHWVKKYSANSTRHLPEFEVENLYQWSAPKQDGEDAGY